MFGFLHDCLESNVKAALAKEAEEFRSYANVGGQVFVSTHSRLAGSIVEAWYWGDLQAVGKAYNKDLSKIGRKRMYKTPDDIISPKRELQKLLPEHQQIAGTFEERIMR